MTISFFKSSLPIAKELQETDAWLNASRSPFSFEPQVQRVIQRKTGPIIGEGTVHLSLIGQFGRIGSG